MPAAIVDQREVTFSPAAICSVIAQSPLAADVLGLPEGPPGGICLMAKDSHVEVVYGSGARARGFALSAEALGALLVAYCARARIPLPRHSRKAITITPSQVTLTLILEIPDLPDAIAPENTVKTRGRLEGQRVSWVDPQRVWPSA